MAQIAVFSTQAAVALGARAPSSATAFRRRMRSASAVVVATSVIVLLVIAVRPSAVNAGTISARGSVTCGLQAYFSNVYCWGAADHGQMGNTADDVANVGLPRRLAPPIDSVVGLWTGAYFACATTASGAMWCWGSGRAGFPADSNGGLDRLFSPAIVNNMSSGVSHVSPSDSYGVSAQEDHSCLVRFGRVMCWSGEMFKGGAGPDDSRVPVEVPGLGDGVSQVETGAWFSCALKGDGVRCWGSRSRPLGGAYQDRGHNSLGDGEFNKEFTVSTPVIPTGLENGVTDISSQWLNSCAVVRGAVLCWGENDFGAVGDGTQVGSYVPRTVQGIPAGATSVSVGHNFACAIVNAGVRCWGGNWDGELGNGSSASMSSVPVGVVGLDSGVLEVSAGDGKACARRSDGVWCWGQVPGDGRWGNAPTGGTRVPIKVSELDADLSPYFTSSAVRWRIKQRLKLRGLCYLACTVKFTFRARNRTFRGRTLNLPAGKVKVSTRFTSALRSRVRREYNRAKKRKRTNRVTLTVTLNSLGTGSDRMRLRIRP